MKKLRILLSIFAIVFAFGATSARQSDLLMTGYEYIPISETAPEQCIERTVDCVVSAANDCTLSGHEVRRPNGQTTCGFLLKKNP